MLNRCGLVALNMAGRILSKISQHITWFDDDALLKVARDLKFTNLGEMLSGRFLNLNKKLLFEFFKFSLSTG